MFQNLNLKCHLCSEPHNPTENQLCEVIFHFWWGPLRVENVILPHRYILYTHHHLFLLLHWKLFSMLISFYSPALRHGKDWYLFHIYVQVCTAISSLHNFLGCLSHSSRISEVFVVFLNMEYNETGGRTLAAWLRCLPEQPSHATHLACRKSISARGSWPGNGVEAKKEGNSWKHMEGDWRWEEREGGRWGGEREKMERETRDQKSFFYTRLAWAWQTTRQAVSR